jgi:hypothetical protein
MKWPCLRALLVLGFASAVAAAEDEPPASNLGQRVYLWDPTWRDLAGAFAQRPATIVSDFEERRWFSFKKTPTVLRGVARISAERGLSLQYAGSEPRTVIVDERGIIVREGGRDTVPPADPRAAAANTALLYLLRFDLARLTESFELFGERDGNAWRLAFVPRAEPVRRALGHIAVAGEGPRVRRIELRRSATQRVEIVIEPPRSEGVPFTAEELRQFFR